MATATQLGNMARHTGHTGHTGRWLWTAALAWGFSVVQGQVQTQAEQDLFAQADRTVATFCPVDFVPLDVSQARANLMISAGQDNPIYNTVLDADIAANGVSTNVLLEKFEENLDVTFVAGKAFAFVMLILLLILWIGGCWCFLIPCCMRCCCRCCEVHHQLGKKWWFHVFLWCLFLALAVGCIVAQSVSFAAYTDIDQGIQGTACYSAKFMRDAVNGNPELNFTGFLPLTNMLEEVSTILEPTSQVMQDITSLLSLTDDLEKAITVNFAILTMLLDLVGDRQNAAPSGSMHKCQICQPLVDLVRPLLEQLEGTVAFALFMARFQVAAQLSGPELTSLRSSIRSTVAPLKEIKAMVVDQIGFYLSTAEGGFQYVMGYIRGDFWTGQGGYLFPVILALFLLCILIVIHGIFSLAVFGCCGGREHDPCCVRYSAGYSLCSSYCYTMLLLLLGGIIAILSTVGSGVCLVMLDFDRQVGKQLLVASGVESEELDEYLDMALNLTDQCMSLKGDVQQNRNLVDLIPIPKVNPTFPGEMSTPRQEIIELAIKPIQDAFAQLDQVEGMIPTVSTMPEVSMVLRIIGQINMRSLIWSDPTEILVDPRYRAMNPAFHLVTLNCPDTFLGPDLPEPLANVRVPGMNSMAMDGYFVVRTTGDELKMILPTEFPETQIQVHGLESDMLTQNWSCPAGFSEGTCGTAPASNAGTAAACRAGKAFLEEKKLPLQQNPVFNCRYFQKPGEPWGTPCEIGNMSFGDAQCIFPSGSMETFVVKCTVDEFAAQISSFEELIRSGLHFVDLTVEGIVDTLMVTLRRLVEENFLNPINTLLTGLDCSFMREFWAGLTSSLCLRSVSGFHTMSVSYVVAAVLSLLVAGSMYIPWRFSRDNQDIWRTTHTGEAAPDAEAPVAETDLASAAPREVDAADAAEAAPAGAEVEVAAPHVPEAAADGTPDNRLFSL